MQGKKYRYLQYHNEDKELVSVYLTERIAELYKQMVEQRKREESRIEGIRKDIDLLEKVIIQESGSNKMLPEKLYGFRLLNSAVGISREYHAFFQLIPQKNKSEYEIVAFYKKREYIYCMSLQYNQF